MKTRPTPSPAAMRKALRIIASGVVKDAGPNGLGYVRFDLEYARTLALNALRPAKPFQPTLKP